jgi:hypothetical protein
MFQNIMFWKFIHAEQQHVLILLSSSSSNMHDALLQFIQAAAVAVLAAVSAVSILFTIKA